MVKDGAGNDLWSSTWAEPNNAYIEWADMSEDGTKIAVVTSNNRLYLLDASTGAQNWYATLPTLSFDVSISGDGNYIVCAADEVYVFLSTSNTPVYHWGDFVNSPVISYYSSYITASNADYVYLYTLNGTEIWSYPIDLGTFNPGKSCAISDDGSHIIIADASTNYNIYYLTSVPDTNISYNAYYTSGTILYLSDTTTITLAVDYIAPSITSYWKVDNEAYHTYSGPFTLSSYSEGNHTLYYYSEDSYGNTETTKNLNFYLDKNPPSITITSPVDGSWVNSSFTITWSGSDSGSGVEHYEIRIDSGTWHDVGTSTFYNFMGVEDGQHTIDVRALDMFSHEGLDSVTVYVDGTKPTLNITSPLDDNIIAYSDVLVSWTASDDASGIDHYEVKMNNGNWINVGMSTTYTFSSLEDKNYTVYVKAIDRAGNSIIKSASFTVDTTPPELQITSPAHETIFDCSDVTIEWTASDNVSGIDHYELKISNDNWVNVGTNTTHTFHSLADKNYTAYVKAIDLAGNNIIKSIMFTVDTTSPTIQTIAPKSNAIITKSAITIQWSGSDNTTDIDHYEIKLDNGDWINVGKNTSYTFSGVKDGKHVIKIRAYDMAGNYEEKTINVLVNTNPFSPHGPYKGLPLYLIIIAIVIVVLIVLMMRRRKKVMGQYQQVKPPQQLEQSQIQPTQQQGQSQPQQPTKENIQ